MFMKNYSQLQAFYCSTFAKYIVQSSPSIDETKQFEWEKNGEKKWALSTAQWAVINFALNNLKMM